MTNKEQLSILEYQLKGSIIKMIKPITPKELSKSDFTQEQVDEYVEMINNSLLMGRHNIPEPDNCYYSSDKQSGCKKAFNIAISKFRNVGWHIDTTTSHAKVDEGRFSFLFMED